MNMLLRIPATNKEITWKALVFTRISDAPGYFYTRRPLNPQGLAEIPKHCYF